MVVVAVLLLLFQSLECMHLKPRPFQAWMVCSFVLLLFMFGSIFVAKRWADAYRSRASLQHRRFPCFRELSVLARDRVD